jgi:hypothetical protein
MPPVLITDEEEERKAVLEGYDAPPQAAQCALKD